MTACQLCGEELGFGSLASPEERASPRCDACTFPDPAAPLPSRQDIARAAFYLRSVAIPRSSDRPGRIYRRPPGIPRAAYLIALARQRHPREGA